MIMIALLGYLNPHKNFMKQGPANQYQNNWTADSGSASMYKYLMHVIITYALLKVKHYA